MVYFISGILLFSPEFMGTLIFKTISSIEVFLLYLIFILS